MSGGRRSGAARPPSQTRHSSDTGPRDRPAGRPAGDSGHGTPTPERADASAKTRLSFNLGVRANTLSFTTGPSRTLMVGPSFK